MRALLFEQFGGPLEVRDVPEPAVPEDGVLVRVAATGVCRSDWHAWQGHDPDVRLPHVPGHELAGEVVAVGASVRRRRVGERVTVPFVCACGRCPECAAGQQQVCRDQRQPGFTHWGSFAELVALPAADLNLVPLPEGLGDAAAASLGCRYATAFRAVVAVGRVRPGEWLVVSGCGGVGLAAVQIAVAAGARVAAVDVSAGALDAAAGLGAEVAVDSSGLEPEQVAERLREATGGGAAVTVDALGAEAVLAASLLALRPRGRHVQVGLLPPALGRPRVPVDRVVAQELQLLGSHGMPAHDYPELLGLVASGRLRPDLLVTGEVDLAGAGEALARVGTQPGTTVVRP